MYFEVKYSVRIFLGVVYATQTQQTKFPSLNGTGARDQFIEEVSDLHLRIYGRQDRKLNIMLMTWNQGLSGKRIKCIKYSMELFISNKTELELLFDAESVPWIVKLVLLLQLQWK